MIHHNKVRNHIEEVFNRVRPPVKLRIDLLPGDSYLRAWCSFRDNTIFIEVSDSLRLMDGEWWRSYLKDKGAHEPIKDLLEFVVLHEINHMYPVESQACPGSLEMKKDSFVDPAVEYLSRYLRSGMAWEYALEISSLVYEVINDYFVSEYLRKRGKDMTSLFFFMGEHGLWNGLFLTLRAILSVHLFGDERDWRFLKPLLPSFFDLPECMGEYLKPFYISEVLHDPTQWKDLTLITAEVVYEFLLRDPEVYNF